jgi:hypothetical protein
LNGVVGQLYGSESSNVTIFSSTFTVNESGYGIMGSNLEPPNGGVLYIESVNHLMINSSVFENISNVACGGVLYVESALALSVKNSLFRNVSVSVSGGMYEL